MNFQDKSDVPPMMKSSVSTLSDPSRDERKGTSNSFSVDSAGKVSSGSSSSSSKRRRRRRKKVTSGMKKKEKK